MAPRPKTIPEPNDEQAAEYESSQLVAPTQPEIYATYWDTQPQPDNLFSALAKAQAEFGVVVKDKSNPAFKGSKYASLDSVIKAVKEPLSKYGLVIHSFFKKSEDGQQYFVTQITHAESGESAQIEFPITLPAAIQQQGSVITYVRRYSLGALLNIVADEDDDGNAASNRQAPAAAEIEPLPYSKTKLLEWAATHTPYTHVSEEERKMSLDRLVAKNLYDTESKWIKLCWENRDRHNPEKSTATEVAA